MDAVTVKYWDDQWKRRYHDHRVTTNTQRLDKIVNFLWHQPQWTDAPKLEIGCGTGIHAAKVGRLYRGWLDNYLGVDVSGEAVKICNDHGVRAVQDDFLSFADQTSERFGLFLFFDVLEHMRCFQYVARAVRDIALPNYEVVGNIPLYRSGHEGFERNMNINVLKAFFNGCGLEGQLWHEVYGCHGYPYMLFKMGGGR